MMNAVYRGGDSEFHTFGTKIVLPFSHQKSRFLPLYAIDGFNISFRVVKSSHTLLFPLKSLLFARFLHGFLEFLVYLRTYPVWDINRLVELREIHCESESHVNTLAFAYLQRPVGEPLSECLR